MSGRVRRETDSRWKVKALYGEGSASPTGPESCGVSREGCGEAFLLKWRLLARGPIGQDA